MINIVKKVISKLRFGRIRPAFKAGRLKWKSKKLANKITVLASFVIVIAAGVFGINYINTAHAAWQFTKIWTTQSDFDNGTIKTGSVDTSSVSGDIVTGGVVEDYPVLIDGTYRGTLVLMNTGKLYAKGANTNGQLGIGSAININSWTLVMSDVSSFTTGYNDSYAIKTDGSLWATGKNQYGELGLGHSNPVLSWTNTGLTGVSKVAVGGYHALVLKSDHTLYGTGYDTSSQLSNGGVSKTSWTLLDTSGLGAEYIVDISAGRTSSYLVAATNADGTGIRNLWEAGARIVSPSYSTWTKTISGGVSKAVSSTSPEATSGDDNVFILKTDGALLVSGSGVGGVLGTGDTINRPSPALGGGLIVSNPATIAANNPNGITISSDGASVYVTNSFGNSVSMYSRNTSTGALTALSPATIAAGTNPNGITISSDGASVYVANISSDSVSMYSRNTSTGALTALSPATIAAGNQPRGITISSDGKSVYVANFSSNTVSMYSRNTSTGALTALSPATIATGANSFYITISSDGASVYVPNAGGNSVSMYSRNTSTGALTALSPATIATGTGPFVITISSDGASAYVANTNSNTVSMYSRNTSTGALTALSPATIAAGTSPRHIAISSDGKSVYVANYSSNSVSMYSRNTSNGALTALSPATIAAGTNPSGITISSDGKSVYVANDTSSNISMYLRNTWTQTASDVVDIVVGGEHAIIKKTNSGGLYGTGNAGGGSGDGRLGNLANGNSWSKITVSGLADSAIGSVSAGPEQSYIIDTSNKIYMGGLCFVDIGSLTALSPATIATGNSPSSIVISPDGASVYVANAGSDSVSMYSRNTSTGALTALSPATIATDGSSGIVISPDGASVYVANGMSNSVSMYSRNTSTGALTALSPATIATDTTPYGITISPDGASVYVVNSNSSTVSMYSRNTSTGALTALSPATIATGNTPNGIVISSDGASVYVTNAGSDSVSMYSRNTSTGALTVLSPATIATDTTPYGITISSDGASVYVTNLWGNSVSMYSRNTSTGALTALSPATIATGVFPRRVTISSDGASVYVTNGMSNSVSMYSRNTSTGALTALSPATIATGSGPSGIVISPDGKSFYVVNNESSTVSMYSRGLSGLGVVSAGRFANTTDSIIAINLTGSVSGLTIDAGVNNLYNWQDVAISYQIDNIFSSASLQYRTGSNPTNLANAPWSNVMTCPANSLSTCFSVNVTSRFIEFKVNLATLVTGPTVSNTSVKFISLSYITDTTPPINPTSVETYPDSSQTLGTEIAGVMSNDPAVIGNPSLYTVYSNASNPSFKLNGAADEVDGSGLSSDDNYAVINKDPSTDPYYAFDNYCQNSSKISHDPLSVGFTDFGDIRQNCYLDSRQNASGTYYLNVRMSDNAGNMAVLDEFPLLRYVFDPIAPNAPTSLTVDPQGWSAPDPKSYTFNWDASDDFSLYDGSNGSGVAGYQYKVDGDVNNWSSFNTTTNTTFTLSDDQVQDGEHTVYVRSIDNAGNTSSPVFVKYRYSGSSPSKPLSPSVDPQNSIVNSFDFSWKAPTDYVGVIKGFRYSVNSLPDINNTRLINVDDAISTSENITVSTDLPTGFYYNDNTKVYTLHKLSAATKQGDNTLYVATVGTPDGLTDQVAFGDGYVSQLVFNINTNAPEPPKQLKLEDASVNVDKSDPTYVVVLSWSEPSDKSHITGYYIQRALPDPVPVDKVTKCTGLNPGTFQTIGSTSNNVNSFIDAGSEDPLIGTCYFYQVISKDDSGKYSWDPSDALNSYDPSAVGIDARASIVPSGSYTAAPSIIDEETKQPSQPVAIASVSTATVTWYTQGADIINPLNPIAGNLIQDYNHTADSFVEFGTDPIGDIPCGTIYGKRVGNLKMTNSHSVSLSGLQPDTLYHYRSFSADKDSNNVCSVDQTFRTNPAPRVENVTIQDVRLYTALLTWYTSEPVNSDLLYGQNTSYSKTISDVSGGKAIVHSVLLTGLQDSSTYHFAIRMYDSDTKDETTGEYDYLITSDDYTFETQKYPKISNVKFQPLNDQAAAAFQVVWDTNVPTTSVVQFKPDGGIIQETAKAKLETKHSIILNGLFDNTYYLINTLGVDQFGNRVVSDVNRVKTDFDTRPPLASSVAVEVSNTEFGAAAKSQVVVSWETDEPATSQVEYGYGVTGEEFSIKSQEDAVLTTSHVVVITDLRPSSSYHLRAVSRDASGNKGISEPQSILTEQARSSVLDMIISSIQSSLGWLFGMGN